MTDDPLDPDRLKAWAEQLAFPRYPGTEGCRRARALVASWLRASGLAVEEEEFTYDVRPAFRAIRTVLLASAALVAAAGLLGPHRPGAALGLLLAGTVAGGTLLVWAPGAERIYAAEGPTRTANVVGRRGVAAPRATVIVLAHYDSKSQNLSFAWRNGAVLVALTASAALAAALAARWAGAAVPPWIPIAVGGSAAAGLVLLSTLSSGNESPGGVDNAGSVAIVRGLAAALAARLPEDVELIALAPSAEEDHMVGAMRWLDRHREELGGRPVHAINFDGAGAPGRPVLIERYGLLRRFAPDIARAARAAAGRLGLRVRRIWLPPAVGIDAIPFHHRGVPCLTISSGSLGAATLAVHSRRDVAAHLDAITLAACARIGLETALAVARVTGHAGAPGGHLMSE